MTSWRRLVAVLVLVAGVAVVPSASGGAAESPSAAGGDHASRPLVIGGTTSVSFPTELLLSTNSSGSRFSCTGMPIGDGWIISAGHCVDGMVAIELVTPSGEVGFEQVVRHPTADLLLLRSPIRQTAWYGWSARPLDPNRSYNGIIAGRGSTLDGNGNRISDTLDRNGSVVIPAEQTCAASWPGFDSATLGCTVQSTGETVAGIPPGRGCFGDSGGLVMADEGFRAADGTPILSFVGVVSGGSATCSLVPGIHVETAAYAGWIEGTTGVPGITPSSYRSPAATPTAPSGYWVAGLDGVVYNFGAASRVTSEAVLTTVDITATPDGSRVWALEERGTVTGATPDGGTAPPVFGSLEGQLAPGEQATTIAATSTGNGYWIATSRGRVAAFGDATFRGDVSALQLAGPVIDMAVTPTGGGYWLLGDDGGIFAFGDAGFFGSVPGVLPGVPLQCPVNGIVASPSGFGYWLTACDGGVFAFGDAPFRNSVPGLQLPGGPLAGVPLAAPIVGMVPFGDGYAMVGSDGGVFNFSSQPFVGSLGGVPIPYPVVAIAAFVT